MKQHVTIIELADRHAEGHVRAFATAQQFEIEAGAPLALPIGRFSIQVSEPYD